LVRFHLVFPPSDFESQDMRSGGVAGSGVAEAGFECQVPALLGGCAPVGFGAARSVGLAVSFGMKLKPEQVAQKLKMNARVVRRMLAAGTLPGKLVGQI
jgi:hypothetical protein